MAKTLLDALQREGITHTRIAQILARAMRSPQLGVAVRAADMAIKIRGDYKNVLKIEGGLMHNHAHAQIPQAEVQARLDILKARSQKTPEEEAIDAIVIPAAQLPHEKADKKK